MRLFITLAFLAIGISAFGQAASIKGQLQDDEGNEVMFANVALYNTSDNSLVKVETSDLNGVFNLQNLPAGTFILKATYIGLTELTKEGISLKSDESLDLGILKFQSAAIELTEAVVKADRVMVEVKADRTVFNVDGTINSTGSDAIELLRKAPAVNVDNNDNISVLGRSGVLLYVDGKRLPLAGADLANYLRNLPADQIDQIDIITNPGAKYEAEGNAGIIDIRLKKDKSHGANGSVRATGSYGRLPQGNVNATGNFRNKKVNVFGTVGSGGGERYNDMVFLSQQNGLLLDEINNRESSNNYSNYRLGSDYFINDKHTIGVLATGGIGEDSDYGYNEIAISVFGEPVDSVLVSESSGNQTNSRQTYNVNYRYDDRKAGRSLNIDLDYGTYLNDNLRYVPNQYYNLAKTDLL